MTDEYHRLPSGGWITKLRHSGKLFVVDKDGGGRPPTDHGEDLWQMAIHVEEQDATIQAQARRIVELEKLTDSFCDQLEDRMWHAEDGTWWRRVGDRLHSADPPGEAEIARMARRHDD